MKRKRYTQIEKEEILRKSNNRCAHCGKDLSIDSGNFATIEHAYPFSKGGEDIYENIVALCYECNEKKGNATFYPEEYYSYLNDKCLKAVCSYVEEKCYTKGYPLGDVMRIVYNQSATTYNAIGRQKTSHDKRVLMNKATSRSVLCVAYEADAEGILSFMIRVFNRRYRNLGKSTQFVLKDEWAAKRALKDAIKYDRVYIITNAIASANKYMEYQAYIIYGQVKDLTIEDEDNALAGINTDYFLTGYNFNKAPNNVLPMLSGMTEYCIRNEVFIPVLEFCNKMEYEAVKIRHQEFYSFVEVKFEKTILPIPEGVGINYDDYIMFFRIPKCVAYGQPISYELYKKIFTDDSRNICRFI